jgi:hypothetical protein
MDFYGMRPKAGAEYKIIRYKGILSDGISPGESARQYRQI